MKAENIILCIVLWFAVRARMRLVILKYRLSLRFAQIGVFTLSTKKASIQKLVEC